MDDTPMLLPLPPPLQLPHAPYFHAFARPMSGVCVQRVLTVTGVQLAPKASTGQARRNPTTAAMAVGRGRRALFVTVPEQGHCGPLVEAAKLLATRYGWQVDFATVEEARSRLQGRLNPVRFVSAGIDHRDKDSMAERVMQPGVPVSTRIEIARDMFMGEESWREGLGKQLEGGQTPVRSRAPTTISGWPHTMPQAAQSSWWRTCCHSWRAASCRCPT